QRGETEGGITPHAIVSDHATVRTRGGIVDETPFRQRAFLIPFCLGLVFFAEDLERGIIDRRYIYSPSFELPHVECPDRGRDEPRSLLLGVAGIPNAKHKRRGCDFRQWFRISLLRCLEGILQRLLQR